MMDRLLDIFLMESNNNYYDYRDSYIAYFDSLLHNHIAIQESAHKYTKESSGDLMNKIKEFFKNLIEKIKQFIKDIKISIKNKFQQIQLQRKLTEIKKILTVNRNHPEIHKKKIIIFDSVKYNTAYNKYIEMISKEITNIGLSKFNSLDDLNNRIEEINQHITLYADRLNLTSSEKYQIEVGIMEAMKVAEQSITIYDRIF